MSRHGIKQARVACQIPDRHPTFHDALGDTNGQCYAEVSLFPSTGNATRSGISFLMILRMHHLATLTVTTGSPEKSLCDLQAPTRMQWFL